MSEVIDRRLNGKNKSAANRERFIKRYKSKLKTSVAEVLKGRSIKDMANGADVTIPSKDIDEPHFGNSGNGSWDTVTTGNETFQKGDRVARSKKGQGRGKNGSDSEDVLTDEFTFTLTKEEFMDLFFDDLELPALTRKKLAESTDLQSQRAGYTTSGTNSSLHILRSMKGALGRRIATGGPVAKELREAKAALSAELASDNPDDLTLEDLYLLILTLTRKLAHVPFIDPIDLRYRNFVTVPKPAIKAVMFCIMDVSASMGQHEKDLAKRYFTLLYMFLTRKYGKVEVVFIRHHTRAAEVTEDVFFNDKESGGTKVSSALELMAQIIKDRYPVDGWNIYGSQVTDGDNFSDDDAVCHKIMDDEILTSVQHFSYIEVTYGSTQGLWATYEALADKHDNISMKLVNDIVEIYPVFRELFKKAGV